VEPWSHGEYLLFGWVVCAAEWILACGVKTSFVLFAGSEGLITGVCVTACYRVIVHPRTKHRFGATL